MLYLLQDKLSEDMKMLAVKTPSLLDVSVCNEFSEFPSVYSITPSVHSGNPSMYSGNPLCIVEPLVGIPNASMYSGTP